MQAVFCTLQSYYAIALVIGVTIGGIYLALATQQQREQHAQRLCSTLPFLNHGRRISTSQTPPRSLSPEKRVPDNTQPPVEYNKVFPPSQRETISKVAESYASPIKEQLQGGELNDVEFRKNIMPLEADYREGGPSNYTPTGFSLAEVRALGDFPDYAELSGVPLPSPYKEFRIETAVARPYRPFRWAYHQTMCTAHFLSSYQNPSLTFTSTRKARIRLVA